MNEEKKLSEMLDEIFGDYINNTTVSGLEQALDESNYHAPKIDYDYILNEQDADVLTKPEDNIKSDFFTPDETKSAEQTKTEPALANFIENLFIGGDIINETDLSFNRFAAVKPIIPIIPITPETPTEKPAIHYSVQNDTPLNHNKYDGKIKVKKLTSVQQAHIARAICNELYALFYIYNSLIKLSKKLNANMLVSFKNGINETKPLAEYIYEKMTGQNVNYYIENIYLKSDNHALNLIKGRINSIFNNIQSLEDNIDDNISKDNLAHIKSLLSFQSETINSIN